MIADQQLAHALSQALQDEITTLQRIGGPYSSNWVYGVTTATGQCYVVKQPKAIRENISPFWQQMDAIFGIDCVTQLTTARNVSALLQRQSIIPVPQVIHVEPDTPDLEAPLIVLTRLAGTAHDPDEFPDSEALHDQLGQYIGYLHTQSYPGYGNVLLEPLHPQQDFLAAATATMRRTIKHFWADQAPLHQYLDDLLATVDPAALYSTANLIMIDISGNQFVYDSQRISGVVDLDAYVIGPREWELSIVEMCITQPAAFQRGYECYATLPAFAPFRSFYRFWSFLNDPDDGYTTEQLRHFMQKSIHFA
ncbi:MAG: aminoglycoside phosphotransferase family protein [Caldilineaceae bacterium]